MSENISHNLIRAYSDGETSGADSAKVEESIRSDSALEAQLAFEKQLRQAVGRSMQSVIPSAPPELADRVRSALARADMDTDDARPEAPRSFLFSSRMNLFALAASLAIVTTAVLYGIFSPSIDDVGPSLTMETAGFVSSEHGNCSVDPNRISMKSTWTDISSAEAGLAALLGVASVHVADLAPLDYDFLGAGQCRLPGGQPSAHVIYSHGGRAEDGCPRALLSVFIVANSGQFDLAELQGEHTWDWAAIGPRPGCDRRVMASTDGSLVYFITCCNENSDLDALVKAIAADGR